MPRSTPQGGGSEERPEAKTRSVSQENQVGENEGYRQRMGRGECAQKGVMDGESQLDG